VVKGTCIATAPKNVIPADASAGMQAYCATVDATQKIADVLTSRRDNFNILD
jgi:hypothetical protein